MQQTLNSGSLLHILTGKVMREIRSIESSLMALICFQPRDQARRWRCSGRWFGIVCRPLQACTRCNSCNGHSRERPWTIDCRYFRLGLKTRVQQIARNLTCRLGTLITLGFRSSQSTPSAEHMFDLLVPGFYHLSNPYHLFQTCAWTKQHGPDWPRACTVGLQLCLFIRLVWYFRPLLVSVIKQTLRTPVPNPVRS